MTIINFRGDLAVGVQAIQGTKNWALHQRRALYSMSKFARTFADGIPQRNEQEDQDETDAIIEADRWQYEDASTHIFFSPRQLVSLLNLAR